MDESDNDPFVLLVYIAALLDRSDPLDPWTLRSFASPAPNVEAKAVARLGSALRTRSNPVVLVLDDAHLVTKTECLQAVIEVARHLPQGSQLALAGRQQPQIPVARFRTEGRLLELGTEDLVLDVQGAQALLRGVGLDLPCSEIERLHQQTEGWPAGLYLAALSLKAQQGGGLRPAFGGSDRFAVDYLWSELLSQLSSSELEFATRTSILDRMCGPLCDALLDRAGSAEELERLERSNRFMVPLDRRRQWYRYHHLFRDVLAAELEKREPEVSTRLHCRAAEWLESNDMPEVAFAHLVAARDFERAAQLIDRHAVSLFRHGRVATLDSFLDQLPESVFEDHPSLVVIRIWAAILFGEPEVAERWADVADRSGLAQLSAAEDTSSLPRIRLSRTTAQPLGAPIHLLRALMCRRGAAQMLEDAQMAVDREPPESAWRAAAVGLAGLAALLNGDPEAADPALAEGAHIGLASGGVPAASMALAERSLIAISRGDWEAATRHVRRAIEAVEAAGLEELGTSALALAVHARCALRAGDIGQARSEGTRAQRLRPVVTRAMPWLAVQTRVQLAWVCIGLSDPAGARVLLSEITEILSELSDLGSLGGEVADLRERLDSWRRGGLPGPSALTAAELRLLPLLATHLSFAEIGERLYISANTVKSQAISIYRKLGVSSRSEAVDGARSIGLLNA